MRWHTAVSGARRRWLTFAGCAIACTVAFGACGDEANPPTAPSGPSFAAGTALSVDLDQCANLSTPFCSWQNGDLNGNNSAFAEGEVVPFRLAAEGLSAGSHTIHLNYDFTAGGNEGYDFLATYNATETVDLCATGGGGVSSLCAGGLGAASTFPFPSDPFVVPDANNLSVAGAEAAALFGVATNRNLTIYGGTITAISALSHSGPTGGNSSVDLTVTFTSNGSAVLLAWGAHLAQSNYWKEGTADDGASVISGAPWHMRTQQLDGSGGNKNQDRSIQPSAVIDLAPAVTIVKKTNGTDNNAAPGATVTVGSTVTWTYEVTNTGNVALTNVAVTDDKIASSAISCTGTPGGSNVIASLAVGATVTCTATGTALAGQYTNVGTATSGTVSDTDPDNYFGQTPILAMTKVTTPATISAGESFSWTITLTNNGPGTATGATIADNLPVITGVTYALDVAGSDGTCVLNTGVSPNTLACGPKDLIVGATLVAKIDATTTPNQGCVAGGFTNTANGAAGNASGVQATATITLQCPALTISKTATNGTIVAGGTATFTIVVTNTGAGKAFNVALSDQLLSTLSWSVVGTFPGWTTCTISGTQLLTCNVATLNAGATATVAVSATVPASFVFQTPVANGTKLEMDGNLLSNGGTDWANAGINCLTLSGCSLDATGPTDDSFGQGTKEDTQVPTLTDGSIPPNKSDLLRFYIKNNRVTVGPAVHDFVYLAWERVLDPQGTTNMDFELNQSATASSNGVTPLRTPGDVLIKYDLSNGGSNLAIGFHTWVASGACDANGAKPPCWGPVAVLTAGTFEGRANDLSVPINGFVEDPLAPNAPRTLSPLTFGEASIDMQLSGIFPAGQCTSFGQAYLKSRSSDSFTAAIKDFVRPIPVSISNCQPGSIPNTATVSATNVTAQNANATIVVNP